jgi:hypothetical protein
LYEVVAHAITKIMCHSSRVLIFFLLYCPENLAGNAAAGYYSSQDCGKTVNTSSVLLEIVTSQGVTGDADVYYRQGLIVRVPEFDCCRYLQTFDTMLSLTS